MHDTPDHSQDAPSTTAELVETPAETSAADSGNTELERLKRELDEARAAVLYARAETENIRRRATEDVQKASRFAVEKFAGNLLSVKDSLEAALASDPANAAALREGVELTLRQLDTAFDGAQIKVADPLGDKFDPNQHQAMSMVDSDQPANTVVAVLRKGYTLHERVLRPALVSVAKGS